MGRNGFFGTDRITEQRRKGCDVVNPTGRDFMRIGIAADHGGYGLKTILIPVMESWGFEVTDYGAESLKEEDDYPDYIVPLAQAISGGRQSRGIAICGSGVGASIAANKIKGIRAALVHDMFSAHQGVEDDNMNLMCLGARVIGASLAQDLVRIFLQASFSGAPRHRRRLAKVKALEG